MKKIGLSRTVRIDWLDAAAGLCLEGLPPLEIRRRLFELLAPAQPGVVERARIVDTLMRAWVRADPALQHAGLALYRQASSRPERVWLHYGMLLAQYPFLRACLAAIGQAARTEDHVTSPAIQARLANELGHLGGNERAVQRLFVTLTDWGVLAAEEKGKAYRIQRKVFAAPNLELQAWVLAAALRAHPGAGLPFDDLLSLPELFPLRFTIGAAELRGHPAFEVQQQGLDLIMVQAAR